MGCNSIKEKLSAYIENQLSSEEKKQVQEHIKSCEKCALSLEELKKTIEYTKGLEELEPPPWLTQKVMARVREGPAQKGILRKLFYPLHIKVPVEVIATLAIAVTAFYVFKAVQPEMKLAKTPSEQAAVSEPERDKLSAVKDKSLAYKKDRARAPEPAGIRGFEKTADIAPGKAETEKPPAVFSEKMAVPHEPYRALDMRVKKESRVLAPEKKYALIEDIKEHVVLTLYADDTEKGLRKTKEIISELGGKVIKTESLKNKNTLFTEIYSKKVAELIEKLRLVGEVKAVDALNSLKGNAMIRIEIVEKSIQLP